jgi:hypothetical protein
MSSAVSARLWKRLAAAAAVPVGTVAAVTAIGLAGAEGVVGAAAITSGLAGVGSLVGGGMAAGIGLTVAAPAVATVAAGYGMYKLAQSSADVRDAIVTASDALEVVTAKGMDVAKTAAIETADAAKAGLHAAADATAKAVPIVQDVATAALDAARSRAGSLFSAAKDGLEAIFFQNLHPGSSIGSGPGLTPRSNESFLRVGAEEGADSGLPRSRNDRVCPRRKSMLGITRREFVTLLGCSGARL